MLRGMTMVFFAYIGFQVVALMGGEIKESSRNVPIATLASIGIVAFIYVGVIIALLSANLPAYGEKSVFDASLVFFGSVGASVVALGAVFSTLSSANANVIGASRITMEMASEKQIPGRFAHLFHGEPVNSIFLGTLLAGVLIIYGDLNFVVDLTNVTTLVTMALVNASAFILVRREHLVPPEEDLLPYTVWNTHSSPRRDLMYRDACYLKSRHHRSWMYDAPCGNPPLLYRGYT